MLAKGDHYIRYYNYTHQLIRKLIPSDEIHVIGPNFFCMDNQGYIYMSDEFACCVCIFTNSGELIDLTRRVLGREGYLVRQG